MSLPFETDLTEYARQCTLQRRHYEECVQEAQKNSMNQSTATAGCSVAQTPAETRIENCEFDECTEQATQGCVVDLLEISVEPLVWDDKQTLLHDASNRVTERQPHSDRSHSTHQHVTNPTRNHTHPVSYGAP